MKRVLTPLAAACLLAFTPTHLSAAAYSGMVVFGDSLSDAGAFGFRFTSQLSAPYGVGAAGVWGNTSPMFINDMLGFDPQKTSTAGGTNYAVGGYRTDQIYATIAGPGGYLSRSPSISSSALYYLNGGGNDFLATKAPGGPALTSAYVTNAANNMGLSLRALQAAGGRYFMMPLLVDAMSPSDGGVFVQNTYDMAQLYNAELIRHMAEVDANVIPLNVPLLYREVLANPSSYGFDASQNLTNTCFYAVTATGATGCQNARWGILSATPDPSKLIYADSVHPTTAMQKILADQGYSILAAPWEISLLPEMADSSLRASNDALRTQLQADWGDWQQTGTWRGFVSGGGQHRNFKAADTSASGTGNGYSVHLGGSYRLSDVWRLGLAASLQQQELEAGAADSDYKLRSYLGTAFAQYHDGLVWFDANLTAGYLDFHDLDRRFAMGITTRSENGDTDGYVAAIGGRLGVELGVADDALKISPFVSADYGHIQVEAYEESGASSTALNYDDQTRESQRLGVGVQARYQFSGATSGFAEITREKEFNDDVAEVGMELNSVRGVDFDLEGYSPENSLTRFSLGAQHQLSKDLALRAGYTYRHQANDNLHGANLSLVFDW